jgi:hypothetical protein
MGSLGTRSANSRRPRKSKFLSGILIGVTNDIDIVADIRDEPLLPLKKCFPEEDFYLDLDMASKAIKLWKK